MKTLLQKLSYVLNPGPKPGEEPTPEVDTPGTPAPSIPEIKIEV
jgi:hypothetical protein